MFPAFLIFRFVVFVLVAVGSFLFLFVGGSPGAGAPHSRGTLPRMGPPGAQQQEAGVLPDGAPEASALRAGVLEGACAGAVPGVVGAGGAAGAAARVPRQVRLRGGGGEGRPEPQGRLADPGQRAPSRRHNRRRLFRTLAGVVLVLVVVGGGMGSTARQVEGAAGVVGVGVGPPGRG